MRWTDFFYYSERDKRGILLLLILIALLIAVHLFWEKSKNSPNEITESDSLKIEFEAFQKTLIADNKKKWDNIYQVHKRSGSNESNDYYINKSYRSNNSYNKNKDYKPSKETADYKPAYIKQEKLSPGQSISLNNTDTNEWKKVPGIGSGYARRIVKYQTLLGGFSSVNQIQEVYGLSEELFESIKPFVKSDTQFKKILINQLDFNQLQAHPYLSYKQVKAIIDLRKRKGKISTIKRLQMLEEFSAKDINRLQPYLSFE